MRGLYRNSGDSRIILRDIVKNNPGLIEKLIKREMVEYYGNIAYLNKKGLLAKEFGFDRYFELEEVERLIMDQNFKKTIWFNNLLISFSIGLIIFLSFSILK